MTLLDELLHFNLKAYGELLRHLKQNYKLIPVNQYSMSSDRHVILRHDIDFSPKLALPMAKLEHDLGVKSTYCILFSSSYYNPLNTNNIEAIKIISKLNHEIGLHYYPKLCHDTETLTLETALLERISGKKVYSISRHGPDDREPYAKTRQYFNANHPLLQGDLYLHDSCRLWHPRNGLTLLINGSTVNKIQLLTHPAQWQNQPMTTQQCLNKIFQELRNEQVLNEKQNLQGWIEWHRTNQTTRLNPNKTRSLTRYYLRNTRLGYKLNKLLHTHFTKLA